MSSDDATRPTDEEILAFSQSVTTAAAERVPLVSGPLDLAELRAEYVDARVVRKIDALRDGDDRRARKLYRTRGDGDCFYRAFALALLEACRRGGPGLAAAVRARLAASTAHLDAAGIAELVYEDFMDVALEMLDEGGDGKGGSTGDDDDDAGVAAVLARLADPERSNAVVVLLRLLASAWMRTHADDYAPYLPLLEGAGGDDGDGGRPSGEALARWVERNVEAMGAEADNVQIHALVQATGVPVHVVDLDGTDSAEANVHRVEPVGPSEAIDDLVLTVLYRPGHYDVLM